MVSKTDKINIKSILGHRYAPKIEEYLASKNITNSKGNTPSREMIRQVVSGCKEDLEIESAIIDLVKSEINKRRKLQQKKEALSKS